MFNGIDLDLLSLLAIIFIVIAAVTLLISRDWRFSIAALVIQYVGAYILVKISWPVQMALVKLIAGWFSTIVLAMALFGVFGFKIDGEEQAMRQGRSSILPPSTNVSGLLFHILATVVIALAILSVIPDLLNQLDGVTFEQVMGALVLIGLGLLHLGFTAHPIRVIFGLLTVLAGFEIIYAAVELSTLVAGLLAGVNLGLAMLGAYLIYAPSMEGRE
ncbi:MAG: hypothetical protein JSV61_13485 [Anaerolineales bacterium]|nr:MAG: hypothetical protein JSV61_13485 [Anaerolineales bacterium]